MTRACDRCGKGAFKTPEPGQKMTAGYYLALAWRRFCNPGELVVCDACMWADARYRAEYGPHTPSPSPA